MREILDTVSLHVFLLRGPETRLVVFVIALLAISTHPIFNIWGDGDEFEGVGNYDERRHLKQIDGWPASTAQALSPESKPGKHRIITVMMPTYNRHHFLPMQIAAVLI